MTVRKIGDTAVTSPMRRALLLVLATMFFLSVTAFAVPPVIYDVTVTDGDTVTTVQTIKKSPESILGDVGIISLLRVFPRKRDRADSCKARCKGDG